jgi:hypothetical protein
MPCCGLHAGLRAAGARWLLAGGSALLAASAGATASGTVPVCHEGSVELLVGGPGARCEDGPARRGPPPRSALPTPRLAGDAPSADQVPAQIPTQLQRQRDRDRQAILQQELAREQQALGTLLRAGAQADPDALRRTRDNLAALQRELGAILPR